MSVRVGHIRSLPTAGGNFYLQYPDFSRIMSRKATEVKKFFESGLGADCPSGGSRMAKTPKRTRFQRTTFNARIEDIDAKPKLRVAFKRRRCSRPRKGSGKLSL
jgi:hypothetical protein